MYFASSSSASRWPRAIATRKSRINAGPDTVPMTAVSGTPSTGAGGTL